jgi:nucleoid DNA-binding protein
MNEKLNLQDLAALLAEKAAIEQKEAETFLKEMVNTIQESLLTDDSVRIKNLGTFKRIAVSDRESVDVATGNRVVIPAHYKIGFTPDNDLAQAVNEPFNLFDSVELDPAEDAEPGAAQEIENTPAEEENEPQTLIIEETPLSPAAHTNAEKPAYRSSRKNSRHKHTKHRKMSKIAASIVYLVLIVGLIGLLRYLYLSDRSDPSASLITGDYVAGNEYAKAPGEGGEIADSITVSATDTTKKTAESPAAANDPARQPAAIKQYTMRYGDRLTLVALREYGHKIFWVYLYEENKEIIKHPDNVPEGTVISIPPASKYGIQKDKPESVQKAALLQQKYTNL